MGKTIRETLHWLWVCLALWAGLLLVGWIGVKIWWRTSSLNPVTEAQLHSRIQKEVPLGANSLQVVKWCKSQKFINATVDVEKSPKQDSVIWKAIKYRPQDLQQIINLQIPNTSPMAEWTLVQFYIDKNGKMVDYGVHEQTTMP